MLKKPKKSKTEIQSYRPITITSQLEKLMEKTIYQKLQDWSDRNNIINSEQAGFRKHKSTHDQLLLLSKNQPPAKKEAVILTQFSWISRKPSIRSGFKD